MTAAGVIAVDGGGSRCRIGWGTGQGTVIVETGPANVFSDFDGAISEIMGGLETLAVEVGRDVGSLSALPAFVGLAGVIDREIADRVAEALPFRSVRIEDDRPAALRGALGDGDGALVHCGTGSFLALRSAGDVRFAGGWGWQLGDEASAFWIGRTALGFALRERDGTGPATGFGQRLVERLGGVRGVLSFAGAATTAEIAALAPDVTDAAAEGDRLARSVLVAGAEYITDTLEALGWRAGLPVCLTGGVGPVYADYLPTPLLREIRPPMASPIIGALELAREFAREAPQRQTGRTA